MVLGEFPIMISQVLINRSRVWRTLSDLDSALGLGFAYVCESNVLRNSTEQVSDLREQL